MLNDFQDEIRASWYVYLLKQYKALLPEAFYLQGEIAKNTTEFARYRSLLDSYIQTLVHIRRRGPIFVRKVQNKRLRQVLAVARTIPWWDEYFKTNTISIQSIRTVDDLRRLPPVQREMLKSVSLSNLHSAVEEDPARIQINTTSGSTTGTPFKILFEKSVSIVNVTAHYLEIFQSHNIPVRKLWQKNFILAFNMFGGERPVRTIPWQFVSYLMLEKNMTADEQAAAFMEQVRVMGGCVLMTHPSELLYLVQILKERDLHPKIGSCVVIGQFLEPEVRKFAESYLRTRVISVYGLREQMLTGEECRNRPNAFHMQGERNYMEIVDDDGKRVEDGQYGNITLTGFDNFLMPLLRYQSGDLGRIVPEPCGCGNPHQLFELDQRNSDVFDFQNGTKKGIKALSQVFMKEPLVSSIVRYQIRQEDVAKVRVLLVVSKSANEKETALLLEEGMRKAIPIPEHVSIEIELVDQISSEGKYKPFVSLAAFRASSQRSEETL